MLTVYLIGIVQSTELAVVVVVVVVVAIVVVVVVAVGMETVYYEIMP